jgi:amino acid adenylation domain-containing protein
MTEVPHLSLSSDTAPRNVNDEWVQSDVGATGCCIHHLFAARVRDCPDRIAVAFEEEQITYAQINERANRLAHYLQARGVAREVLVGICLGRSTEMIVAILAVLKAGGAYVPLDPAYPTQRLAFMIEDSGVRLVLTELQFVERVARRDAACICLDADERPWDATPNVNPADEADAEDLAYVIYTSGSTGVPKGVAIEHRGVCNLALAQARLFEVRETSRVLQFASLSFDASVSEIFKTLLTGATLVLPPRRAVLTGAELTRTLRDCQINVLTVPPSILGTLSLTDLPALESLIVAGEACPVELAAKWREGRRFYNAYGPTEVTVCATIALCEGETSRLPIGYTIPGAEVYVLDARMLPVAADASGELYVGGVGIARGYLNRPDLTAERFVPDPYSGRPGGRLYRTGDVVRYRPDGQLEFIGRSDEQLKVRGFRIELGEIEAALHQHRAVKECAVVAIANQAAEKQLVAYVAPVSGHRVTAVEMREHLLERLPVYMIPAAFHLMDRLPLTPNGKIDRRALAASPGETLRGEEASPAPRTPLQHLLAKLFEKTLGLEKVGIMDNFFALGGDSIKAAVFLNKLQEEIGEVVYVVALFDAPTIAALSDYLEKHYGDAVARVFGGPSGNGAQVQPAAVDIEKLNYVRRLIKPLSPLPSRAQPARNPAAVFILSPPRSGSTLLRVMLAGHRQLFAPPELQLLCFNDLDERRKTFLGRYQFWLEGTIRALMEIQHCSADEASQTIHEYELARMPVQDFYGRLQDWVAPRILVDKTPAYAFDLTTLKRAEIYFKEPLYIHLIRHPNGMVRSFEDAKLDQIFRYEHPYTTPEIAEILWTLSHQNILQFLDEVPSARQHRIKFEDLVKRPEAVMKRVCSFLNLEYDTAMIEPHQGKVEKMTDGIHGLSRMLGDIKFHTHQMIDPDIADRWKAKPRALGEITWQVAELLGYERQVEAGDATDTFITAKSASLPPLRRQPRQSSKSHKSESR